MYTRRIIFLMGLFLAFFAVLSCFLAYWQLFKGFQLASQAAEMRSQRVELEEWPRGEILDRNLLPLTGSESSLALYCLPHLARQAFGAGEAEQVYKEISRLLGPLLNRDQAVIYQQLMQGDEKNSGWVRLAEGLDISQQQKIEALNLPPLIVMPITKRYRNDGFCVHLIGYLGGGAQPVGLTGVEKLYNDLLGREAPQDQLVAIHDARGKAIKGLMFKIRQQQAEEKSAVVLTIDRRVQDIAEQAMNRWVKKGAIVVMDVHSKDVLAVASRPGFDPYRLADSADPDAPLINRALYAYYPGSMFKILLAAAVLEEGLVKPGQVFNCSGKYFMQDGFSFSCLRKNGHGQLSFEQAFALSCNPIFIEAGQKLGRERLLAYIQKMHVNDKTVIGFPGEKGGEIKINPGLRALANACLGQQGVKLTPLQICSLISTIADNGYWSPPRLLSYTVDAQGEEHPGESPPKEQVLSESSARVLQRLMERVVSQGTGSSASFPEARVAGKTGTSQTGALLNDKETLDTWFGGYFPTQEPRWAVVVLVEEGESGARSAAPVFREIAQGMVQRLGSREK